MNTIERIYLYFLTGFVILVLGIIYFVITSNPNNELEKSLNISENKKSISKKEYNDYFVKNHTFANELAHIKVPSKDKKTKQNTPIHKFLITDLLGQRIPEGTINVDNQIHQFFNGIFEFRKEAHDSLLISATAEGYQPYSEFHDVMPGTTNKIILDYYQNISVYILSDPIRKLPIANAKIILSRMFASLRPLQKQFDLNVHTPQLHETQLDIGMDKKQIKIKRVLDLSKKKYQNLQFKSLRGLDLLESETKTTRSHYLQLKNTNSLLCRLWDTLTFYNVLSERRDDTSIPLNYIDYLLLRNTSENIMFYIPGHLVQGSDLEQVKSIVTDDKGLAKFSNCTPSIYFVSAIIDNVKSEPIPLSPSVGGYVFFKNQLANGSGNLDIRLLIKDEQILQKQDIFERLSIFLHSSHGIFGKKSNKFGKVEFRNLKYGHYKLIVTDPEHYMQTKTLDIKIEKSKTLITVDFQHSSYTVAGKVIDDNNDHGVPNVDLVLERITGAPFSRNPKLYFAETNEDGHFAFYDVMVGEYKLKLNYKNDSIEYIQKGFTTIQKSRNGYFSKSDDEFLVHVIQDITNIKFYIQHPIKTIIAGSVVSEDGEPIKDAFVRLTKYTNKDDEDNNNQQREMALRIFNGNWMTNDNGDFRLEILSSPYKKPIDSVLEAMLFSKRVNIDSESQNQLILDEKIIINSNMNKMTINKKGTHELQFQVGDRINDIFIVAMKPRLKKLVLSVNCPIEPKHPIAITLYGMDNNPIHGTYTGEEQMIYHIPSNSNVYIEIQSMVTYFEENNYGNQPHQEAVDETIVIAPINNEEPIYKQITIKKAGYLAGKLIDKNKRPIPNCEIQFQELQSKKSITETTDAKGLFWVYGLDKKKKYSLHFMNDDPVNHIYQPTNKNLVIQSY